ncbi:hypothetical protein NONS58_28490 [Nitrosococcus oceani]|nr:hypothetical protein NONS58_28490 [Nitrosococcus oceani]
MTPSHRRHDLSDEVWAFLEPHLPGRKNNGRHSKKDRQQSIKAVSELCARVRRWDV